MNAHSFREKLNSDAKLAKFISENFVAAAADITQFTRRQDPDGEYFRTFRKSYCDKIGKNYDDQGV